MRNIGSKAKAVSTRKSTSYCTVQKMYNIKRLIQQRYHKGPNWRELFSSRDWTKYIFWSLIAFLAGLTVRDVTQLCLQYADDPKQTEFKMIFNESMSMPNLTFCISKEQAYSHFNLRNLTSSGADWDLIVEGNLANMTDRESFLNSPWDFRVVVEAYEVIAAISSMERETNAHGLVRAISNFRTHPALQEKRRLVKMYLDVIDERNVTFTELTQKTGIEVLKRSMKRFERQTYDEDKKFRNGIRISWISQMQMCFKPEFDENNFVPIEDQGAFFVMLMSHNIENLDGMKVDCMTIDLHGRPSSIARFMQGKSQIMDGFNEDLCLGLRHEVYVDVRAYYEMLENDEEGTACRDADNGEEDEFDCRSRCRLDLIREIYNCTAHSLSYLVDKEDNEYPLCDYIGGPDDAQNVTYTDKECMKTCYRNCKQIRFQVDHEVKGPMLHSDLTMVTLTWRSFEYLSLQQDRVYTLTSFIAELGGSIGVWLGLSVLSLFQGLTLLLSILRHEVKHKIIRTDPKGQPNTDSVPRKRTVLPTEIAANPFASPFDSSSIGPKCRQRAKSEPQEQHRRPRNPPLEDVNPHIATSARM